VRAVNEVELLRRLRSQGVFLDLYRAPIMKIELKDLIHLFTSKYIAENYYDEFIAKNIEHFIAS
jgi:hypothetical protein